MINRCNETEVLQDKGDTFGVYMNDDEDLIIDGTNIKRMQKNYVTLELFNDKPSS